MCYEQTGIQHTCHHKIMTMRSVDWTLLTHCNSSEKLRAAQVTVPATGCSPARRYCSHPPLKVAVLYSWHRLQRCDLLIGVQVWNTRQQDTNSRDSAGPRTRHMCLNSLPAKLKIYHPSAPLCRISRDVSNPCRDWSF